MLARTGKTWKILDAVPVVAIYPTCACCGGRGYVLPSPPRPEPASIIAAIAASIGKRLFTIAELMRHAEVDEALRLALSNLTRKQLGQMLKTAAIEGTSFDGIRVVRYDTNEHNAAIWELT